MAAEAGVALALGVTKGSWIWSAVAAGGMSAVILAHDGALMRPQGGRDSRVRPAAAPPASASRRRSACRDLPAKRAVPPLRLGPVCIQGIPMRGEF